jgi:Ni,Fe-hydrogenase III small subunit
VLVCSGPVTRQIEDRLVRIYEQMPEPKFVVAVGTCACSGGVFQGCYNVKGGIDAVLPVSAYIPGCPASPAAIIDGVVKLLTSLQGEKLLAEGDAAPGAGTAAAEEGGAAAAAGGEEACNG